MPARVDTDPSFIAPSADSVRSSQCWTMVRSNVRAYSIARRISSAFMTGRPSSDTATQPASLSSPISDSDSPASPFVIAPTGYTRTAPTWRARPTISSVTARESLGGDVLGIEHTAV